MAVVLCRRTFAPDWRLAENSVEERFETAEWGKSVIMGSTTEKISEQEDDLKEASDIVRSAWVIWQALSLNSRLYGSLRDGCVASEPEVHFVPKGEERVRPIDDCNRSGLNGSYACIFTWTVVEWEEP